MQKLISGARSLGLYLDPTQVSQFETYYQELVHWNRKMNLTAIVDYEEVQLKHLLDSLTIVLALEHEPRSLRLLDLGTGAGLPGVPPAGNWTRSLSATVKLSSRRLKTLS